MAIKNQPARSAAGSGGAGHDRAAARPGRGRRQLALGLATAWLIAAQPGPSPAATLKPGERVVLYPALARAVPEGWELEIHGLVYEPERRRLATAVIRRLVGLKEDEMTTEESALFRERMGYFMVDDERNKTLSVKLGGETFRMGVSQANGHFTARWLWRTADPETARLWQGRTNGTVQIEVRLDDSHGRALPMQVHCLGEHGLSVISDIDDTIKISQVRDRHALLRNTFCRPYRAVDGMAGLYREWEARDGAQFHYVTASPWQLYLPLVGFARTNGFPEGTYHMKEFRVKDGSALNLFTSPARYKPRVIEPMFRQFPARQFVLVGDSGEKDPEIYGALARAHRGQVRGIYIRNVSGEDAGAPRYGQAFRGLPSGLWQVFTNASEIRSTFSR